MGNLASYGGRIVILTGMLLCFLCAHPFDNTGGETGKRNERQIARQENRSEPSVLPQSSDLPDSPLEILSHQGFRWNADGTLLADGAIKARWRNYLLNAGKAEGSTETGQFLFSKRASLEGDGVFAQGDRIWLDTRERNWWLENGFTRLSPEFLQGNILTDLYAKGDRLDGGPELISGQQCSLTTCELDHPHFEWSSRNFEAIPEKRAVLRRVKLRVLDHTLFTLPYLIVPLNQTYQRSQLPEVGRSADEGFYLKYALGYVLTQSAFGNAKLDLMEKKGLGIGTDQQYPGGNLNLYFLRDRSLNANSLTGRLNHTQPIGALQTNWNLDYRSNSYLVLPDNTAWNLSTDWTLPGKTGQTRLTAKQGLSKTGAFESKNYGLSIQDNRTLGKLRWNMTGDYLDTKTLNAGNSISGRREWIIRTSFNHPVSGLGHSLKNVNAQLDFNRNVPVGSASVFFGGLERVPELSLVGKVDTPTSFDPNFRLSLGRFSESGFQRRTRAERYAFELNGQMRTGGREDGRTGGQEDQIEAFDTPELPDLSSRRPVVPSSRPPLNPLLLNWQYGFRQAFYSDDTAQYILRSDAEARLQWGMRSSFSLRWNYLRPYGYSPLLYDRSGFYNQLSADLRWSMGSGWSIAAQSGYDLQALKLQRDPWQALWLNLLYEQPEVLRWRMNLVYDPNESKFTSLLTDLLWQFGDSRLALTARYDPRRARWGSVNARLDALKWGKMRFSTILQYNGYLNRFEGRHFLLTYDLHCAELEMRYIDNPFGFRHDREFMVYIRLKAFPPFSRFGYGQSGELLGGGGESF